MPYIYLKNIDLDLRWLGIVRGNNSKLPEFCKS